MEDDQLLMFAAKASGLSVQFSNNYGDFSIGKPYSREEVRWNPLDDDGDALRLAVKLGIGINFYPDSDSVAANIGHDEIIAEMDDFGTRRAIVRVAAEIGRRMP